MRSNNKRKGTGRTTYAILVDGETEKWYLEKLRQYENPAGITIKPDLPDKTKLADQFRSVKKNAEIYDVSVWIIDLDVVLREENIDELGKYIEEAAENKRIRILINTPCLEFWFLQHVQDTGRYFPDGVAVTNELKKCEPLKQYEKSKRYFVSGTPDIYNRLRPHLNVAIQNAGRRGHFDIQNPQTAKAEIYKLFSILGIEIKD
ncbi:RloB family protein [Chitinophaga barathri]|uniref:RloB domain-containing protein n=1 Tax=Chitinophaga barathri TaxID=1647451 RepID=A0A3N4MF02_9BACT|nr:RloB family protein [Chitinophaga barathri]RPD41955.1 RloB domain-containing protein [Chitinophaga barathri]